MELKGKVQKSGKVSQLSFVPAWPMEAKPQDYMKRRWLSPDKQKRASSVIRDNEFQQSLPVAPIIGGWKKGTLDYTKLKTQQIGRAHV